MSAIETAVRVIVGLLTRGEYTSIERLTHSQRLNAEQLRLAIADYGRTLVEPADAWWDEVTVTPIDAGGRAAFHVAAPLWTLEEGRSDLTLEVKLVESGRDIYGSEVLDLHVP